MIARRIVPRERALKDIEAATDFYADQAGEDVALRFVEALERAFRLIATRPAMGSSVYAHELALPGLRHRRLTHFPWLVFYIERDDHVDVWRVLHEKRDIPATMRAPDR